MKLRPSGHGNRERQEAAQGAARADSDNVSFRRFSRQTAVREKEVARGFPKGNDSVTKCAVTGCRLSLRSPSARANRGLTEKHDGKLAQALCRFLYYLPYIYRSPKPDKTNLAPLYTLCTSAPCPQPPSPSIYATSL